MTKRNARALALTAYHEAGHAVAGSLLGLGFRRVSIQPADDSLGHVLFNQFNSRFQPDAELTPAGRDRLERHIMCSLAGPIAEKKMRGRANSAGASADYSAAVNMASYIAGGGEATSAYITWLYLRTDGIITSNWYAVEAVATALLAQTTIRGPEVGAIIFSAMEAEQKRVSEARCVQALNDPPSTNPTL